LWVCFQERQKLFQFFDEDGNGVLDRTEMGKLNACLFNMFPRFGYKGTEPPGESILLLINPKQHKE